MVTNHSSSNYSWFHPPQHAIDNYEKIASKVIFPIRPPETQPSGTPPLNIKCGPLLRFIAMKEKEASNIYQASVLIVTDDRTSDYSRAPQFEFRVGPSTQTKSRRGSTINGDIEAEKIFQEENYTFWRFYLKIAMKPYELKIVYSINYDPAHLFTFYVPAIDQTMNIMTHSCNGFSLAVDTKTFKGSMWLDVLREHEQKHYHVMLGGGDQIYCDSVKIFGGENIGKWAKGHNKIRKLQTKFTDEFENELNHYYLEHYIAWFGQGYWKGANSSTLQSLLPVAFAQIPSINIFDDHDIIDGYGSYHNHTMSSPVFQGIGKVAFKYYSLFQQQVSLDEDLTKEPSFILSPHKGPYIHQQSRSIYARLGKEVAFYGLDCRTERKHNQICTTPTYARFFQRIETEIKESNGEIKHLLLMLGVPIAYPRLVWLEWILSSRLVAPIKWLSKKGIILKGFVNEFDGSVELLDDLDDHWCARNHKTERNWFVKELQLLTERTGTRITILSGDVHLCAIGKFYSKDSKTASNPATDSKFMLNVITSAIVNTPPPNALATLMQKRSKIHHFTKDTDEDLENIFKLDVDSTKRNTTKFMNRRNWCSIVKVDELDIKLKTKPSGPVWSSFIGSSNTSNINENNIKEGIYINSPGSGSSTVEYPIFKDSLSIQLHVEKDRTDVKANTAVYEVIVPALHSNSKEKQQ